MPSALPGQPEHAGEHHDQPEQPQLVEQQVDAARPAARPRSSTGARRPAGSGRRRCPPAPRCGRGSRRSAGRSRRRLQPATTAAVSTAGTITVCPAAASDAASSPAACAASALTPTAAQARAHAEQGRRAQRDDQQPDHEDLAGQPGPPAPRRPRGPSSARIVTGSTTRQYDATAAASQYSRRSPTSRAATRAEDGGGRADRGHRHGEQHVHVLGGDGLPPHAAAGPPRRPARTCRSPCRQAHRGRPAGVITRLRPPDLMSPRTDPRP